MKVRLLDDTVKTILIDDSRSVGELVEVIGKKIGLKNPDEFSLQTSRRKGEQPLYPQAFGLLLRSLFTNRESRMRMS